VTAISQDQTPVTEQEPLKIDNLQSQYCAELEEKLQNALEKNKNLQDLIV
jgi:hypothetical protein